MVHYGIGSRLRRPPIPPHSKESASSSSRNSTVNKPVPNSKGIISAPVGPPNVRSSLNDGRRDESGNLVDENAVQSSDESIQWDEFFGQSVDIASALLDMYDSLIAQNKGDEETNGDANPEASSSSFSRSGPGNLSPVQERCQPDSTASSTSESISRFVPRVTITSVSSSSSSSVSSSATGAAGRLNYSDSGVGGKNKRPLSASSLSSSSSSSSSSLPRNAMDVKKSYLASIESLDDDASEEDVKTSSKINGACSSQSAASGGGATLALDTTPPYTRGLVTPSPNSPLGSVASSSNASCLPGGGGGNATGVISSAIVTSSGLTHIDRVLLEIVETERTYVSDLKQIIQGYLKRIPTTGRDAKISESDFTELFGNIEDIYRFNSMFLSDLERCGFDPVAVARAFVQHSNGFAIYTQYCTNYPRTVEVLTELMGKPKTAEVFKERQTALHHNLPLGSYLLKPVQRILKYHLLLQNIVKHSDKESRGYPDIKNALSVMTGIAYHINDMKRKHEHAVRVQEIQSLLYGWQGHDLTTYGELVAEGSFRMLGAKALRHIFLFDKMLLIAKKKEEAILSYKTHIMCSNLMLIESIQGEPLCFHVIPFDYPKLQYTFQARNLEQKREWCLQLKRVILENYNAVIPSHARQLVMELGQNKPGETQTMEKTNNSSSRSRLLSAPEYLERRKHDRDRRKSEISLNRAFKLRKSSKKMSRRTRSCSTQEPVPLDYEDSNLSCEDSRHADATPSPSPPKRLTSQVENNDGVSVENNTPASVASRTNENEADANNDSKSKRLVHPAFRAWKSLPEETTDTENEDGNDQANVRRLLQYRPPTSRGGIPGLHRSATVEDEYVTLFFAQAHAYREAAASANNSYLAVCSAGDRSSIAFADQGDDDEEIFRRDVKPEKAPLPRKKTNKKKSDNYDNLTALWAELGTVDLKNLDTDDEKLEGNEEAPPETLPPLPPECVDLERVLIRNPKMNFSWRRNTAVRRVQSFTGLARAKVASLHHSFSFKQNPSRSGQLSDPEGSSGRFLPSDSFEEVLSPTAPAIWLKRQAGHLSDGRNKCGSLPRSFQLGFTDINSSLASDSSSTIASVSDETAIEKETSCRPRMRSEGSIVRPNPMNHHQLEQRPITIASDKPAQVDFMDDIERYMDNASRKRRSYRFPVQQDEFEGGITPNHHPRITSPSISLENVNHTIHPEHKIYHHSASKYAALKNALSNVGSKFAILKASVSPSSSAAVELTMADTCSTVSGDSEALSTFGSKRNFYSDHSPSRCSSGQFDRELSPSTLTNKVMSSIAKAYSAMIKQRLRKDDYSIKLPESGSNTPASVRKGVPPYRPAPNSSVIGARMARPLESEYCVPKTLMHLPSPSTSCRNKKEDLRPDSVLSESSNATSSSDGDKKKDYSNYASVPEVLAAVNPLFNVDLDQDDSPSDTSVASGDSYYERTFEAIENALVDEMFRDSAIYSDPEEADLSSTELSNNQVYHKYHRNSRDFTLKNHLIERKGKENASPSIDTEPKEGTIFIHQNSNNEISKSNEKNTESIILERLKILEENSKFRKGDPNNGRSTLEGIKSIRQRRLELENCLAQGKTEEVATNDENDFANSVLSKWKESTTVTPENHEVGAPKMKGWVKHVVHKLQTENL